MLKKEIKKLPHSELEIKVTVPWDDWKEYREKAAKKLAENLKIPGFRPGKVPADLAERKLGKNNILDSAASQAVEKTYAVIIEEEKFEAIGSPRAEILKFGEGSDLEYKVRLSLIPEIKISGWKEEIKKINEKYKDTETEVKEDELLKELEKLAQSRAKLITVNREAKKDDNVVIDFQVFKGGIPIEGGTSVNHSLILGKGVFIPGFEENISGMKALEEKNFNLSFPENYFDKKLAGTKAEFKVKLKLVQERQVPEISDEFAKSLGKFEDAESLKKSIRDGMKEEAEAKRKEERKAEIIDKLVEKSEADLPHILIEEELKVMFGEFEGQLRMMGMEADAYLEKINKNRDDLEKEWRPKAEKRIKSALILEKIAKDDEIEVSSEEIEVEMNKTLQFYKKGDLDKNIDMKRLYNYCKGVVLNEKVFNFLEKI